MSYFGRFARSISLIVALAITCSPGSRRKECHGRDLDCSAGEICENNVCITEEEAQPDLETVVRGNYREHFGLTNGAGIVYFPDHEKPEEKVKIVVFDEEDQRPLESVMVTYRDGNDSECFFLGKTDGQEITYWPETRCFAHNSAHEFSLTPAVIHPSSRLITRAYHDEEQEAIAVMLRTSQPFGEEIGCFSYEELKTKNEVYTTIFNFVGLPGVSDISLVINSIRGGLELGTALNNFLNPNERFNLQEVEFHYTLISPQVNGNFFASFLVPVPVYVGSRQQVCQDYEIPIDAYCHECITNSDCPSDWLCFPWEEYADDLALCLKSCYSDADCRSDFNCADINYCTPDRERVCDEDDNVWLRDTCGEMVGFVEECSNGYCYEGECIPEEPECTPNASIRCFDGNSRWLDSCGVWGDIADYCTTAEYCEEGVGCVENTTGRFIDLGNGTLRDTLTEKIWQREAPLMISQWESASGYCADLSLGGSSSWRLPTSSEQLDLFTACFESGCHLPSIFVGPCSTYWGSEDCGSPSHTVVQFSPSCSSTCVENTENNYTRCIKD